MKHAICSLVLVLLALSTSAAWAKEGADQYPNGGENWFAGAVPPPGPFYVNYFGHYGGNLKTGSGQNAFFGGSTPSVSATFNAFRYVEMTPFRLFGANYGVHAIVPVVYQSVNLGGTASKTGIGDMIVNPFLLGWHHPQWHAAAGLDIFLPTGFYNANDARVSIGAHYYGFDPLVALSYMPKSGWEASVKLMYDLKTTNPATKDHSGQEFHTDFAAGRHLYGWMLGGTGYFLEQTTDDTIAGQIAPAVAGMWDAGHRGQVLAIGPSAGYTNRQNMSFMVDWQHETLVRNRFGGDKVWFKMIVPVDSLLHRRTNQVAANRSATSN